MKRYQAVLLASTLMFGANAMAAGPKPAKTTTPAPRQGASMGWSQHNNNNPTVVAAGPRQGGSMGWSQHNNNGNDRGNNWNGNGGHGNSGHGYYTGGHNNWHGNNWNGHRSSFSFNVGVPFWYGGYYGYSGYNGYSPYYYPRTVVIEQPAPVYVQQAAPVYVQQTTPPPQTASENFWYFCPDSKTYYPYVQNCTSDWLQVVPNTSP